MNGESTMEMSAEAVGERIKACNVVTIDVSRIATLEPVSLLDLPVDER